MPESNQVVAIGLLTQRDLAVLGQGFQRAYRVQDGHDFHDLLSAIDYADRRRFERDIEK
jgi:hypothetical protein